VLCLLNWVSDCGT